MRKLAILGLVLVCSSTPLFTQQKPAPPKPAAAPSGPELVVREWFRRWNALDGTPASVKSFLELYLPDAMHQLPPNERQIGPVFMEGTEALQKMAEDFARVNTAQAFRIESLTPGPKSTETFFKSAGPWDGPAVAVQYVAVYTDRATTQVHTYPGFGLFHIENGKIRYARFYHNREEHKVK